MPTPSAWTASSSSSTPPRSRRPPARCCSRWASGGGPAPLARGAAVPQGEMNVIVNSHEAARRHVRRRALSSARWPCASATPAAYRHSVELGAWDEPHAAAMELNIPAIHGVGDSLVYFVDRYRDFSVYDVDFVPFAAVDPGRLRSPPCTGSAWCRPSAGPHARLGGVLRDLFGFSVLPQGRASACCRTARSSRARATSSTCS